MQRSKLDIVLLMIDEAFNCKSWHGTNLYGSIRRLSVAEAEWRPDRNRHNIWEIVMHVAYWKHAVRRKLLNEPRRPFAVRGSNWLERPAGKRGNGTQWDSDVALLVSSHRSLRDAIGRLDPEQLETTLAGSKVSTLSLLTGIAAHDLYHAGQIQLLKRFYAADKASAKRN